MLAIGQVVPGLLPESLQESTLPAAKIIATIIYVRNISKLLGALNCYKKYKETREAFVLFTKSGCFGGSIKPNERILHNTLSKTKYTYSLLLVRTF